MNGSTDYVDIFIAAPGSSLSARSVENCTFSGFLTNQTLTEVVGTTAAAFVAKNAAQAVASATLTKITFAAPSGQDDPQSWWNAANNRYIPTIPGYYQVSLLTTYASPQAGTYENQIYKNGATISNALGTPTSGYVSFSPSIVVYMNGSTDYLEAFTYQASGSSQNLEPFSQRNNFSISLVGANQAVPAVRETTSAYGIGSNTTGSNQYANCEIDNLRFFWKGGGGASVFISTISGTTTIQGAYGRNAYGGGADAWGLAPGVGSGPLTVTTTPVALTVNWSTMGQIIATFRDIGAGRSYQMNAILQHSYQNSQIFVNRISD
jgi:hypothetical protein